LESISSIAQLNYKAFHYEKNKYIKEKTTKPLTEGNNHPLFHLFLGFYIVIYQLNPCLDQNGLPYYLLVTEATAVN